MSKGFYIPTLNGWRAISILAVIIHHATYYYFYKDGITPNESLFAGFEHFSFGVHIFFGISGFLIISRMLAEEEKYQGISVKEFYLKRVFRILPPLLAYFFFIIILSSIGLIPPVPFIDKISALFFFRNYIVSDEWYFGHFWSLSFEEHFYIFWPFFFIFFRKKYLPAVLSLVFLVVVWRKIEYRMDFYGRFITDAHFTARTDLYLDYILLGAVSAYFYTSKKYIEPLKKFIFPGSIFLFFPIMILIKINIIPLPFREFILAILIQCCLLSTCINYTNIFSRLLESRIFHEIGKLSYSLYIWQQFFFPPLSKQLPGLGKYLQIMPLNIIALFIVSYLSYRYIEKVFIAMGRKYIQHKI